MDAHSSLGPWPGFKPRRLGISRPPEHTWFHCTTTAPKMHSYLYLPLRENERRSPAWQAGILTTIYYRGYVMCCLVFVLCVSICLHACLSPTHVLWILYTKRIGRCQSPNREWTTATVDKESKTTDDYWFEMKQRGCGITFKTSTFFIKLFVILCNL